MKGGLVFILIFLLISISFVSSAITFPASNISIKISGTDRTLQYAADNGLLKGTLSYASAGLTTIGQHDASQIWVNVNGAEKTLLSALSAVNGLCGSGSYSTYSSTVPNPGHVATEIILSSGQTLQTLINLGIFCTTCIPGETKTCGIDERCVTYPTITCNPLGAWPICPTPLYTKLGTGCGRICPKCIGCPCLYTNDSVCDGAGACVTYTAKGTGCCACPYGSTSPCDEMVTPNNCKYYEGSGSSQIIHTGYARYNPVEMPDGNRYLGVGWTSFAQWAAYNPVCGSYYCCENNGASGTCSRYCIYGFDWEIRQTS